MIPINLLMLLLLFHSSLSQNQSTTSFSQYNCRIFYKQMSNGSLSFEKCRPINTTSTNYLYISWKQCASLCCGITFQAYPYFNQQSLSRCQSKNDGIQRNNDAVRIVAIVLSVVLATTLITAIIYKIVERLKKPKVYDESELALQNQTVDPANPTWLDENQSTHHTTLSNFIADQSNECPICLEQDPILVTACSHRFHVNCLMKWLSRNRNCPLCKRTDFEQLKLKCKNCQNKYLLVTVGRIIKNLYHWRHFKCICSSCHQSPKLRTRSNTRDQSLDKFRSCQIFESIQTIQF